MLAKLLECLTGKDDLERVAAKGDLRRLNECLETRPLWIPRRPRRYLDAATFTQEQLLELLEEEAKSLSEDPFEPWVLEMNGKQRLPAFSSRKRMQAFSGVISKRLNKVFSLGCMQMPMSEAIQGRNVDFVDLNLYCGKSWEIGVGNQGQGKSERRNT